MVDTFQADKLLADTFLDVAQDGEEIWRRAVDIIARGGLVAFPTDTVYGVGCDPYNVDAIMRIYEAKGRPSEKALPLLLSGPADLERVAGSVPPCAEALASVYWPGALTLVVPRAKTLPIELSGRETIAVRVPDHGPLRAFIAACGGAIAATSANRSGEPDSLTAGQVAEALGGHVELIIDGGPTRIGVPSTLVDCTADPPIILRAGAIPPEAIFAALDQGPGAGG